MFRRAWIVARAQLAGEWLGERGSRLPIAPVLFLASIAGLLCALARGTLEPYAYGVYALSLTLALVAMPLLGELGPLLRADVAADWIGGLPLRPLDLRLARVIVIMTLIGGLSLACLAPAALLAPGAASLGDRVALIAGGLAAAALMSAVLLWLQAIFGERGEGVLVLVQAVLLAAILVGVVVGTGQIQRLAALDGPTGPWLFLPSAWYALPLMDDPLAASGLAWSLASAGIVFSLITFAVAPFPPRPGARSTRTLLSLLLDPVRRLAAAVWVRPRERASFELVYAALPAERDFVVRTYPLVAAPLAFLLLGADPSTLEGQGLFAILLFATTTYLPFLLMFVPCTATPAARHLLDTAPLLPEDEHRGAQKAIAVRFLFPLWLGLSLLVANRAGLEFTLRLAPVAGIVMLIALRAAWPTYVSAPPLSTAPADLGTVWRDDLTGGVFLVGIVSTLLAMLAWRYVPSPAFGLALGLAYALAEIGNARRSASRA